MIVYVTAHVYWIGFILGCSDWDSSHSIRDFTHVLVFSAQVCMRSIKIAVECSYNPKRKCAKTNKQNQMSYLCLGKFFMQLFMLVWSRFVLSFVNFHY